MLKRLTSTFILTAFILSTILPHQVVMAQHITAIAKLPSVGTMMSFSPEFTPTIVKGLTIHPDNPLRFDFIVDTGNASLVGQDFQDESTKLIKYFLASLTTPEDELWVNLSPYEKDRIIPESFGETNMGIDLLTQDYILKQLTASLIYPEEDLGSEFWKRVYAKAQLLYGTTDIPVNTFNKIWIVPETAVIYEHENSAFIVESHMKVLLEEDYLALKNHRDGKNDDSANLNLEAVSGVSSEVIREVLLPEIEKEINSGENFATLRQINNSMILAMWYKGALKESLLGQVYVDQNKTKGIEIKEKTIKQDIYNQYLEAFKLGVYDYIKEDYDAATQQVIPRKYFSGGYTTRYGSSSLEDRIQTMVLNDPLPEWAQAKLTASSSAIGNHFVLTWDAKESQIQGASSAVGNPSEGWEGDGKKIAVEDVSTQPNLSIGSKDFFGFLKAIRSRTSQWMIKGDPYEQRLEAQVRSLPDIIKKSAELARGWGLLDNGITQANNFSVEHIDNKGIFRPSQSTDVYQVVVGDESPKKGMKELRIKNNKDVIFISPHADYSKMFLYFLMRKILLNGNTINDFILEGSEGWVRRENPVLDRFMKDSGLNYPDLNKEDISSMRREEFDKTGKFLESGVTGKMNLKSIPVNPDAEEETAEILRKELDPLFENNSEESLIIALENPNGKSSEKKKSTENILLLLSQLAKEYRVDVQLVFYQTPEIRDAKSLRIVENEGENNISPISISSKDASSALSLFKNLFSGDARDQVQNTLLNEPASQDIILLGHTQFQKGLVRKLIGKLRRLLKFNKKTSKGQEKDRVSLDLKKIILRINEFDDVIASMNEDLERVISILEEAPQIEKIGIQMSFKELKVAQEKALNFRLEMRKEFQGVTIESLDKDKLINNLLLLNFGPLLYLLGTENAIVKDRKIVPMDSYDVQKLLEKINKKILTLHGSLEKRLSEDLKIKGFMRGLDDVPDDHWAAKFMESMEEVMSDPVSTPALRDESMIKLENILKEANSDYLIDYVKGMGTFLREYDDISLTLRSKEMVGYLRSMSDSESMLVYLSTGHVKSVQQGLLQKGIQITGAVEAEGRMANLLKSLQERGAEASSNVSPSLSSRAVGGIDLNPVNLNLQIKRDGKGIPLPVHQQPIENIKIDGFSPVIINIVPINVPALLGMADQTEEGSDMSQALFPQPMDKKDRFQLT